MAKRVEPGDQTMELSTSQLVPDAPPRPRMPPPQIAPHDASVWKQVVVGSADFAPPPPARSGRARTWAIVGAASIAVGVGGAFAWHRFADDDAPAEPATPSAESRPSLAKSSEARPAETAPAAPKPPSPPPAPAVATEAPAAGSGSAGSTAPPDSPASPDDERPATWLAELAAWLSPPEAVASLFAGLAPWTPTATAPPPAAKKPPPVLRKAPAAPKKPPAPKKPVPPTRNGRR